MVLGNVAILLGSDPIYSCWISPLVEGFSVTLSTAERPIATLLMNFLAGFLGTVLADGKIPSAGDVLSGAAKVHAVSSIS
ncbi:hypothetical protein PR202_ga10892 [Eleusine coracana subsp. coracana]|uniref:Uncharacterized protein n=1 Tax=Eleusine coracana subsp. coracana TaxID=191504 RepID=A0AAV5C846_ELECO|nr:hypothetical protein PR202_ga10892 [Eleusine coracana subsp. coracana]